MLRTDCLMHEVIIGASQTTQTSKAPGRARTFNRHPSTLSLMYSLSHLIKPALRSLRPVFQAKFDKSPHLFKPFGTSPATRVKHAPNDFAFLPSNSLPSKPRKTGLTEIRGPYYTPVTQTYLDELLKDWGEYVDVIKFAGGSFSLMPPDRLKGLIAVAHKHG